MADDDLGEVREGLRQLAQLPFGLERVVLLVLRLGYRGPSLRVVERQAPLLQGEAVDVGVLDGVCVDGGLDREPRLAEAAEDGVVQAEAGRARRLRPSMWPTAQRCRFSASRVECARRRIAVRQSTSVVGSAISPKTTSIIASTSTSLFGT